MLRSMFKHHAFRTPQLLAAVLVAVLIAACGSSSPSSGGGTTTGSSNASGGGSATVVLGSVSGYGNVLETSSGQALYVFSADGKNSSTCTKTCASVWTPLTPSGTPTAGSGVKSSMLSTFKRSDGTEQVSYNGHPLYTYGGPAGSGAGLASNGGVWYLVAADGTAVKHTKGNGY